MVVTHIGGEEPVLVVVVAVWCRAGSSLHGCKAPVSRFGSASSGSGFKLGEVGLQSHGFCPEEAADFLYAFGNYAPHTACGTPRPPGKQHLLGDPWALGARSLDFPLSMRVRPRHFVIEMDPPRQSSIP